MSREQDTRIAVGPSSTRMIANFETTARLSDADYKFSLPRDDDGDEWKGSVKFSFLVFVRKNVHRSRMETPEMINGTSPDNEVHIDRGFGRIDPFRFTFRSTAKFTTITVKINKENYSIELYCHVTNNKTADNVEQFLKKAADYKLFIQIHYRVSCTCVCVRVCVCVCVCMRVLCTRISDAT